MFAQYNIWLIVGAFSSAFLLCMVLIPHIIKISLKNNLIDKPGIRKLHSMKISRLGGIGIFLSSMFSFVIFSQYFKIDTQIIYLAISTLVLFITGVADDIYDIKANIKFLIQILVAVFLAHGGFRIENLYGVFGINELPAIAQYILSVLIIVGVTNAFNLIDGIDGLAGAIGLINFFVLGLVFSYLQNGLYSLISFAIAGSILAFLYYNFNPAKIFMGDGGSLVLGFLMVALGLFVVKSSNGVLNSIQITNSYILVMGIMLIPVVDTVRVMTQRIMKKQSPFRADQNHIHHLLLRQGLNHKQVALLIAGANVLVIITSFLIKDITVYHSLIKLFYLI